MVRPRVTSPNGQAQKTGQHVSAGCGAVGNDLLDGRRKLTGAIGAEGREQPVPGCVTLPTGGSTQKSG